MSFSWLRRTNKAKSDQPESGAGFPSRPAGHNRNSTEEQIALAIKESMTEKGDPAADEKASGSSTGEWACLQCTFLNPPQSARCAMCLAAKPGPESASSIFNQPPEAAPVAQHRRMSTEEQINMAIQKSMDQATEDDEKAEMFDGGKSSQSSSRHERMATADQIAQAISQTSRDAQSSHRRMTTEDQINQAISMTSDENSGAKSKPKTHRRMSTEEQILQAIELSAKQSEEVDTGVADETFDMGGDIGVSGGVAGGYKPLVDEDATRNAGEAYVLDIINNPELYQEYTPPPQIPMSDDVRLIIELMIRDMATKKAEIHRLRLHLNKERQLAKEIQFELDQSVDRVKQLEQQQQESGGGGGGGGGHGHMREPSYGGIRELFAEQVAMDEEEDDAVPEPKPIGKRDRHVREPSYGGIRELFDEDGGFSFSTQKQEQPQPAAKRRHAREPSYGGIREMFTSDEGGDEGGASNDISFGDKLDIPSVRAHNREPSYGGIMDIFMDEEDDGDDQDGGADNVGPGLREMFADEDDNDDMGDVSGVSETYESEIKASFDVVWNLLVEKVHHPQKYLPVEDVAVEHRDGRWVRHMFLTPMDLVITEEIAVNEERHQISFVDTNYPDMETVNKVEPTDDPNVQNLVFYKQNRNTGDKVSNISLTTLFKTDVHFLKQRAQVKMKRAVHAREPSYGQVSNYVMDPSDHNRDVSYGGVGDFGGDLEMFSSAAEPAPEVAPKGHARDLTYGGVRDMFTEDPPEMMDKLQQEVFRIMDVNEWSKITKGMVVEEVEQSLNCTLKPYQIRFVKITIMRIIDGKLKLECFAGEQVKDDVLRAEAGHGRDVSFGGVGDLGGDDDDGGGAHNREASYGGVQQLFEGGDLGTVSGGLDELDSIYSKAEKSDAVKAVLNGGFNSNSEKEIVRKTRRHSRQVSYGGVMELESAAGLAGPGDEEEDDLEVVPVSNVKIVRTGASGASNYLKGGGFNGQAQRMTALEEENDQLRERVMSLSTENSDILMSKRRLVEHTANEMERLRNMLLTLRP